VARELSALVAMRGKPKLIVSDHATEFTSKAMLAWTEAADVAWHFIASGEPMQNGICEGGRMPDELLNETLFLALEQAHGKVANWVTGSNHGRPHSAIA
jgi:putative transposase